MHVMTRRQNAPRCLCEGPNQHPPAQPKASASCSPLAIQQVLRLCIAGRKACPHHMRDPPPNLCSQRAEPPVQHATVIWQPTIPGGAARCQCHHFCGIRVPPSVAADGGRLVPHALGLQFSEVGFVFAKLGLSHCLRAVKASCCSMRGADPYIDCYQLGRMRSCCQDISRAQCRR